MNLPCAKTRALLRSFPQKEEAWKQAVLEQRAQRIASKKELPSTFRKALLFSFQVAGESYALEAPYLKRVFPHRLVTRLPERSLRAISQESSSSFNISPPPDQKGFFGIALLKGEVVPLLDLRTLFSLPSQGVLQVLLQLSHGGETIALGAEKLGGILETPQIHPLPEKMHSPLFLELALGITENHTILLSGEKLLEHSLKSSQ